MVELLVVHNYTKGGSSVSLCQPMYSAFESLTANQDCWGQAARSHRSGRIKSDGTSTDEVDRPACAATTDHGDMGKSTVRPKGNSRTWIWELVRQRSRFMETWRGHRVLTRRTRPNA